MLSLIGLGECLVTDIGRLDTKRCGVWEKVSRSISLGLRISYLTPRGRMVIRISLIERLSVRLKNSNSCSCSTIKLVKPSGTNEMLARQERGKPAVGALRRNFVQIDNSMIYITSQNDALLRSTTAHRSTIWLPQNLYSRVPSLISQDTQWCKY